MGRAFYEAYPDLKRLYDEASAVLEYDCAALCFEGPAERLNLTEYTQPALLVSSIAAWRMLEPAGIKPVAVAGHSLGEYSALVAAGGLPFSDAVALVQKRGRYMSEAVAPGSGLVVALLGLTTDVVEDICRQASSAGVVAPANYNSPGQIVIAGEKTAVERAIEVAKMRGCKRAIPLSVSVPVHTPLMQQAADRLAADVASVRWSDLSVPLINNVEAKAITKASDVQSSLIRQLPSPVLWIDTIQTMARMGVTTFVEVGPGTVLTGLIKRILPEAKLLNVQDPATLLTAVNALRG
jgi:[acyl-carrier-protein] S-malonyltransferase